MRYFRQIDQGLQDFLREEPAPLVLAGVEYLLPIYKEANTYPHLLGEGITGNPEGVSPEELHRQAWALVEPHFRQEQEKAAARYRQLAGTGKTANDAREIVPAAYHGRVECLFVAVGRQQWGDYDPGTDQVSIHPEPQPGDFDVLDLAATQTLLQGGTVYAVEPAEVPDSGAARRHLPLLNQGGVGRGRLSTGRPRRPLPRQDLRPLGLTPSCDHTGNLSCGADPCVRPQVGRTRGAPLQTVNFSTSCAQLGLTRGHHRQSRQGREVFCFFDHEAAGFAAPNALQLQDPLRKG